ncbi:hypothetical protein Z517_08988 [Fonsecaea pedrosoi CBS 271.37]|uniref:Metallo-beta-lactamase domain-containing protein n=1 Tax=Fonsecaea pedrosoi CBS 271.37 TaxID=1442368 RepID=A0A0D2GEF0_9EURO|nr:uncharacterized protein Z517_08988 [Fonsecaea pedrosoi CBS 271.37]KIW79148.1 hypothetical protein Z517_08988 [Fonsecaea pedrosoi CBS 271.37]
MSSLRAAVYVAPAIPWYKPNGVEGGPWSPISSTLIYGEREAVLVDTPITTEQTRELADWIARTLGPSKRLTSLYITHGHGDHWFGIPTLVSRFPGLTVVATKGTISHMRDEASPQGFKRWNSQFPNQIDQPFRFDVIRELPASGEFLLEDHLIKAIEVGHSDTHHSTILWVPDLKLAVCGDVVYGEVHQMLAIANKKELREEWIRAVEKVQGLRPELVVPGHQKPGEMHGTWHLENTKQYIKDFAYLVESGEANDARSLSGKMMDKYPNRFNKGALVASSVSAFALQKKPSL